MVTSLPWPHQPRLHEPEIEQLLAYERAHGTALAAGAVRRLRDRSRRSSR